MAHGNKMNFKIMLTEICEETLLTPEELYHFSSWMQSKFTEADFDEDGEIIND
jgi:hypothetical protein